MRNPFERGIGVQLKKAGVSFEYETLKLPYMVKGFYTPDFVLSNGIILESKGYMRKEDQIKMRAVKIAHPELDIRFIFYNAEGSPAGLKMTNAQWATKYNFKWCDSIIPDEWLIE